MNLPVPHLDRWQPLRLGLVDLYHYDTEEFWFHDGRLLLRGNNGAGKSKVLALTLPFLLDGDTSPYRVEPDGDRKKHMEWNLLLGGAHENSERTGYAWLEFGRLDAETGPEFFGIGCGMKAVRGRSGVTTWFFTTSRRIGAELSLISPSRTALAKARLAEAIGATGTVHDTAKGYRKQLDEKLFRLGEDRYAALVDLLIQLRRPQLTKEPDEALTSAALTEALPPIDGGILADVAEAFRALEEDRRDLEAVVEARDAAGRFLEHYHRYACTAARRRAEAPRLAQSAYEEVRRQLGLAHAQRQEAETAVRRAETTLEELDLELQRLQAREKALQDSDDARAATDLQQVAAAATRAREAARTSAELHDQALARERTAERELEDARTEHDRAATETSAAAHDVLTAATAAGLPTDDLEATDPATVRTRAERETARRAGQVRHVSALLDEVASLEREHRRLQTQLDREEAAAARLQERLALARADVATRAAEHVADLRAHLASTSQLRVDDLEGLLSRTQVWTESMTGASPARTAVTTAVERRSRTLGGRDADLRSAQRARSDAIDTLEAERGRLLAGEDSSPPAARFRGSGRDRDGAPLWRLVDFREDLTALERAGLEGALEASGLLDGWVSPAGDLTSPDGEALLVPTTGRPRRSLAGLLRPAVDREEPRAATVSDPTLTTLLECIGTGEGEVRADVDGSYQLGVLTGRWSKPEAEFLGRGAREAARRRRLREIDEETRLLQSEVAALQEQITEVEEHLRVLGVELAEVPDEGPLRSAHSLVLTLSTAVTEAEEQLERDRADVTAARERALSRRAGGEDDAGQLGLPFTSEGLQEVTGALAEFRLAVAGYVPARVRLQLATTRVSTTSGAAQLRQEESRAAQRELATRRGEEAAAAERFTTLEATVGAAVQELRRRLGEVETARRKARDSERTTRSRLTTTTEALGHAKGEIVRLDLDLAQETERRATAAESLYRFACTGVLAVALPELEIPDTAVVWAPDPTVRLARQVEQALEIPFDDNAWRRVQQTVTEEVKPLADTLSRHGHSAELNLSEDVVRVEVRYAGRPRTVPALRDELVADAEQRRQLLDAREREVLENHLVAEVASALQELIGAADRQVNDMNAELERRPTSTGMRLRMQWRVVEDGPAGLTQARERLLRQSADAWSLSDQSAVGAFLKDRIDAVRADREGVGTWLEHLTTALDYRSWHRFVVQRYQNGQWRPASGPASGGEKVLAASVPLFAAASAHYRSAGNPHAPRIITLDEAFAGVDDTARADYLGLLAEFDLDVVMTSEREWACYPQVPGIAISNVSRREGVDAVLVTSYRWDGRRKQRVARPVSQELPVVAPRTGVPDQEGLFP
ncbi:TIGR02680 family protein [Kineococcus sp. NBC_00420]|uniref:TIGR02680 family protein n=1 Tax=Kineococcus sp. NBC_00420 TaxID=2903564 RepID=UPI002E1FA69D